VEASTDEDEQLHLMDVQEKSCRADEDLPDHSKVLAF